MSDQKIQAVRGMHDITPDKSAYWAAIEQALANVFSRYAFREIRMPLVESTQLFKRSIGEVTDIVEKEMYTFPNRKDELISLRPEGTAGCVRACIQHGLLNETQKLWYLGPMFRYEKPQKGRQRQFHQVGGEAFGYSGTDIELECLLMMQRFWQELGVAASVTLQINNIGSAEDRSRYRQTLVDFLQGSRDELDADSQRRLETNPLRILDSKVDKTQQILRGAPELSDSLSPESVQHMTELTAGLDELGIAYEVNTRLVRGLDYYNDTVFEWASSDLGAQGTVCAGGRYDGLVEQLGGKATPAFGFAMGLERLYLLLEAHEFAAVQVETSPLAFIITPSQQALLKGFELSERLRDQLGDSVIMCSLSTASMKSQLKKADKYGARFALILGETEMESGSVSVKDLSLGEQKTIAIDDSLRELSKVLSSGY